MATLTPRSAAAIARLRSYLPPPTSWYSLPLSRRAAVLIVLFADKKGGLRVVLTMRAATLRNYAGQAALPGGKADTMSETPAEIARREANEEVGLPAPAPDSCFPCSDHSSSSSSTASEQSVSTSSITAETKYTPQTPTLPYPFHLEHLCQLPTHLAKTELGVRPVVAFLSATSKTDHQGKEVDVEKTLMPRLDAKEVAAVFSAPFFGFLKQNDEVESDRRVQGKWYEGSWIDWHEDRWRMHNFYVPVRGRQITWPREEREKNVDGSRMDAGEAVKAAAEVARRLHTSAESTSATRSQQPSDAPSNLPDSEAKRPAPSSTLPYRDIPEKSNDNPLAALSRFRVFGMTARILVDCARIAYAEEPEFPHNNHFGDEAVIERLVKVGRFVEEREKGAEFEGDALRKKLGGWKPERKGEKDGKL